MHMSRLWPWVFALLSGIALGMCYPPVEWGNLCWVALMPLATAVWFSLPASRLEWLRLGTLGYICGLGYFSLGSFWLTTLTVPGWILLVLYFSFYPAMWTLFLGAIAKSHNVDKRGRPVWLSSLYNLRICALGAAAWVSIEWLRGVIFPSFGWNGLGVALKENIPLIQITDITGVGGLSFLVAMVNLMTVATVKRLTLEIGRGARRPHYDFAMTIALVALVWVYGIRQVLAPQADPIEMTFAAVQANVPQEIRNNPALESDVLDIYKKHTETAAAANPDLILWPESATPRPIFNDQRTWDTVSHLTTLHQGDLLLGTVTFTEQGAFNSIVLLTKSGHEAQVYNKIHLVPFGEYVPLRKAFPLFAWIVGDLVPDDFDSGICPNLLEMNAKPVKLAPLICFEDTVGSLARQFVSLGAQMFVVVTNDGWFLESAGSQQHLSNAVFRCAENKIPMIRAANTGITCVVDRFGAVHEKLQSEDGNTFIEGVLFGKVSVPLKPTMTFYARYGEFFSLFCLGISCAAGCFFIFKTIKRKNPLVL